MIIRQLVSSVCYWSKRCIVFMRRFHHSRGFGIQSPSSYRFVRYVINEHYPYYAYTDLEEAFPHESKQTVKLAKLYFRIANAVQAEQWGFCMYCNDIYTKYIQAGCCKTAVVHCVHGYELDKISSCDVLVMTIENEWKKVFETFLNHVHHCSVLIVEDIHTTKFSKRIWQEMIQDGRTGVSYDLYYCGIILFDPSKTKQHYIINF